MQEDRLQRTFDNVARMVGSPIWTSCSVESEGVGEMLLGCLWVVVIADGKSRHCREGYHAL